MPGGAPEDDSLLSDRLEYLSLWLREYEHDGVELAPLAVQGLVAILNQATLDAGALERQVVPGAARVDPAVLAGNVVPLNPESPA